MKCIRSSASLTLIALALTAFGCGSDDDDGSATTTPEGQASAERSASYVGKVEGTDANVAVKVAGDRALGYLCDGKEIWGFVTGDVKDGKATLSSEDGNYRIEATVEGDAVNGTATLKDGAEHSFTTEPAEGDAGFYQLAKVVDGVPYVTYWVKANDGSVRGKSVAATGDAATGEAAGAATGGAGAEAVPPEADPVPTAGLISRIRCNRAFTRYNNFVGGLNAKGGFFKTTAADIDMMESLHTDVNAACPGVGGSGTLTELQGLTSQ